MTHLKQLLYHIKTVNNKYNAIYQYRFKDKQASKSQNIWPKQQQLKCILWQGWKYRAKKYKYGKNGKFWSRKASNAQQTFGINGEYFCVSSINFFVIEI